MSGPYPSTEHNAVPNVDDTDLGEAIARLANTGDPDLDLIATALRNIAHRRLTINDTQVLGAALAGDPDCLDVAGAVGYLHARLFSADTNPALRALPFHAQTNAQQHGKEVAHRLNEPDLRNPAANANAALD